MADALAVDMSLLRLWAKLVLCMGAEAEFLTQEVALAEVLLGLRLRLCVRLIVVILAACATGH